MKADNDDSEARRSGSSGDRSEILEDRKQTDEQRFTHCPASLRHSREFALIPSPQRDTDIREEERMTTAGPERPGKGFVRVADCTKRSTFVISSSDYTPYEGDASFLAGPTAEGRVWDTLEVPPKSASAHPRHRQGHPDATSAGAGRGCEDDGSDRRPADRRHLKRAMMPNGGWRMVETAIHEAGKGTA